MKPKIAVANEARATSNIAAKIALLKRCIALANVDPDAASLQEPTLYALVQQRLLPTSVRKFNSLASEGLPEPLRQHLPLLERNANATLNRHKELKSAAILSIAAWRRFEEELRKRRRPAKVETIAKLRRAVKFNQTIRMIAERELLEARERIALLMTEVDELRRSFDALKRQAAAESGKHQDLQRRLAKTIEQKVQHPKVVPLK